jgi:hypothetical protein
MKKEKNLDVVIIVTALQKQVWPPKIVIREY